MFWHQFNRLILHLPDLDGPILRRKVASGECHQPRRARHNENDRRQLERPGEPEAFSDHGGIPISS
jgi:hypothetical protein